MAFLRSSAGFHLDVPAEGLRDFAGDYRNAPTTSNMPATRKKKPSKKDLRRAKNNRNKETNPGGAFVGSDYQRPALGLFNDHCDLVVDKYGLEQYFFRGRVEAIRGINNGHTPSPTTVMIRTASDASTTTVSADNIVLAVGNDDPLFPEWAANLVSNDTGSKHKISHLLQVADCGEETSSSGDSNDVGNEEIDENETRVVAIIGGGISAVHKALQLTAVDNVNNRQSQKSRDNNVVVHIVSRHPVREQQFDTHQDWMMTDELAQRSLERGGKGLTNRLQDFQTLEAPAERRAIIQQERIPGTVPTYMTRARGGLEEAMAAGKICWHVAGVASAGASEESAGGGFRYELSLTNGEGISADEIILATGLGKRPPGHAIIHPLASEAGLPLSNCGYPLVDHSLHWKPSLNHANTSIASSSKIFVSGGLAELELGPSARNIAGARMAAERISATAGSSVR
jgi:hypothetical protein